MLKIRILGIGDLTLAGVLFLGLWFMSFVVDAVLGMLILKLDKFFDRELAFGFVFSFD